MRILIISVLSLLLFYSCNNEKKETDKTTDIPVGDSTGTVAPIDKSAVLMPLNSTALTFIKNRNFDSLVSLIHPVEGVRFSPYAFVDTVHDVRMTREKLLAEARKNKQGKMVWGEYDGTGDPIQLTLNEYLKRFVYDADYLNPEKMKLNEFIGGGNTSTNIPAVYPGCDFIESYFSGFDKKYEGMDWRGLRLVYKMHEGQYYLIGIVHDEWTT